MRVAFVPSAPFLLPGLGDGPTGLRSACLQAISTLHDPVTVLGAAPRNGPQTGAIDATLWGARGVPSADPLPLALAVGAALLGQRDHLLHGVATADQEPAGLVGDLLVVADGSATRTEKAPGHFDARAEGFDVQVQRALAAGDPAGLLALDPALAAELWVGGLGTWQEAARALRGRTWHPEVLWSGAPHGVFYVVATWVEPD